MSLKITCPKCKSKQSIPQPLPLPGSTIQCIECGQKISMTYPEGVIDKLRAKGLQFEGDTPTNTPPVRPKIHQKSQQTSNPTSAASSSKSKPSPSPKGERPTSKGTRKTSTKKPKEARSKVESSEGKKPTKRRWFRWFVAGVGLSGLLGVGAVAGVINHFEQEVPSVEDLREYEPPTVTTLYDRKGEVLAELYKKRRYVREYEAFPKHLIQSFMAAEDANFLKHGGMTLSGHPLFCPLWRQFFGN